MIYDGPVIDGHHHLWDLSMGRHPWLTPQGAVSALGDLGYLHHDYLPADFEADAAGAGVAATIVVEALWDARRDPYEEVAWLDGLECRPGLAGRYVARADLASPGTEDAVARLGRHPRVAGVRQTIRWHPDPSRQWADRAPMEEPAWRRGVGLLRGHGLLLELLMYPWQADAVADLARAHHDLPIVVNHCSSPIDRDEAGIARWHAGLAAMAQAPNVTLKLSNVPSYAAAPTPEAMRAVMEPCLAAFGPARCLWGSDYPVARKAMSYTRTLRLVREALADVPVADQRAILCGNAARLYGLGEFV